MICLLGVAGTKNWDVNGTKRAIVYNNGMNNFNGNPGDFMIVNQNTADSRWKM